REVYLVGNLSVDRNRESTNRFFFSEPKFWKLPKGRAFVQFKKETDGRFTLTIRAKTFLKSVRVEILGEEISFDDNYFDLDAGEVKTITFNSDRTSGQLRQKLRLRWL
ncbi:MAG TPA: glycoside hydrolase family 2 protein, partial [Bacteroidota bacterium]|nr:glycoside hydrolase family 2 protein [Bacteroidota bacterium]